VVVSIGGTTDITICRQIAKDGSIEVTMNGMVMEEEVVVGMIIETGARMDEVAMMSGIGRGTVGTAEMAETTEMVETEEAMAVVEGEVCTTMNEGVAAKARSTIARRGVEVLRGGIAIETEKGMGTGRGMRIGDEAAQGIRCACLIVTRGRHHCLTAENGLNQSS